MSNSKIHHIAPSEVEELAVMFKALSNPNRLRLYLELLPHLQSGRICSSSEEQVESCQKEIAQRMELAPSTVSHHFKELKNAKLIFLKRRGKSVDIQINIHALKQIRSFLNL
ncbi:ArsR/SmtB family transcription factor [Desulfopila sp. IMCC35008]|uniref:ArsR/SmtB family transcription factor n=1 Tax=Desulfopila sp. IMCC35008 TaxID=2653858 RepID=UPI0035118D05